MSNTILGNAFKAVADAIRAKGVTGTMSPLEMPAKVASIPTGGSSIKYGVDLDGMIGDVDANGVLQTPDQSQFSSTEIRSIPNNILQYKFYKRPVTSVNLPNLTSIGNYGMQYSFYQDTALATVDLSGLTSIGNYGLYYAFYQDTALTTVDMSSLTSVGEYSLSYAFYGCPSLTTVDMSSLALANYNSLNSTFVGCTSLKTVYLSKLSSANSYAWYSTFNGCTALEIVDFSEATAVPPLNTINAFSNTNSTYRILVPPALYDSWIAANNWSNANIKPHIEKVGLRFKANTANSTIQLVKAGSPPNVSLEYSTDGGRTYSTYTVGDTITLANVDDMVMFRAGSAGNATMATSGNNYHMFAMTGSISAEGSAFYLLNKYGTVPTTVPSYCFTKLFYNCTSLTTPPELPATTLADHCYYNMFDNCTSLTTAPELPATTLGNFCYLQMFYNCSSLTTAPTLPATTLKNYCYMGMFYNCTSLNEIRLGYTGNFSTTYFNNWVNGVAASGTLYYGGTDTTTGASAIPTGWTVKLPPYGGLAFTAREAGSTVKLMASGSAPSVSLQYSTDEGISWNTYTRGDTLTLTNIGDRVCFKATTTNSAMASYANNNYNYFVMTGQIAASGNINSLLNENYDAVTTAPRNAYVGLFDGCSALVDAQDLILASTTASQNSYGHYMFRNCTNLVNGPQIMATNFTSSSWIGEYMFYGCSSLASVKIYATSSSWLSTATVDWMNGVPATGTFYYNGPVTSRGTSYIPTGWTITPFST